MATSNFNLRNVPPEVMSVIKKEALKQKISANSLILGIIEQGLGVSRHTKKAVFHDLDDLAGTWSKKDKEIFDGNIKCFENIDKELWS